MAISAWTEAVPSDTSTVGTFPAYARAVWAAISAGLAVEHFWPGSGGGSEASAGDLRPGASRAFVDVRSASSAPSPTVGRALFTSDTTRLLLYDSTGTYLGGTPFLDEVATDAGAGVWTCQAGSYSTTVTGNTQVTFPIPFLSAPKVWQTVDNALWLTTQGVPNASFFGSQASALAGGAGTVVVSWEALGTVSARSC